MFVDDNVVGLGPELVHDIRVPGVADQNSTFSTVGGMNGLPDAERQVPQAVWRIGSAQVGEIRTKSHFEINNLDARPASRYQCSCYRADGLLNTGNINSGQVEHPALGAKIVLHVYDDYRSFCDINRNRFGLRSEPDNPALRVLNRRTGLFC